MNSNFLPPVSLTDLNLAWTVKDLNKLYDLLTQPLHEELYRRGSFDFFDELTDGQQLLVAYDYVRMQVGQGGFIQFIENGYVGLLPSMIEQLTSIGATDMADILDDVLKVFVLNNELLNKPSTVEEFAQLYNELKEFEIIDQRYETNNEATVLKILEYAMTHLNEFVNAQ